MTRDDQERYDNARAVLLHDEAVRQTERNLWDRGIAHVAESVGTRDLGRDTYLWAVDQTHQEAEARVREVGE